MSEIAVEGGGGGGRWLVVGCGRAKVWSRGGAPDEVLARDAYVGSLFRGGAKYAVRFFGARWFILSARYALLRPDDLIRDYDEELRGEASERAVAFLSQQLRGIPAGDSLWCVAGKSYVRWLRSAAVGRSVIDVLAGVPLFERMQLLKEAVAAGREIVPRDGIAHARF